MCDLVSPVRIHCATEAGLLVACAAGWITVAKSCRRHIRLRLEAAAANHFYLAGSRILRLRPAGIRAEIAPGPFPGIRHHVVKTKAGYSLVCTNILNGGAGTICVRLVLPPVTAPGVNSTFSATRSELPLLFSGQLLL